MLERVSAVERDLSRAESQELSTPSNCRLETVSTWMVSHTKPEGGFAPSLLVSPRATGAFVEAFRLYYKKMS